MLHYNIYLARLQFYIFTNNGSERQLLLETNAIWIQYKLANISKSVFTTFFCSNQFFLLVCHSANCVCKTESKHDFDIHIVFCLKHTFIWRLHSSCLQFKSFCPVMWIYNQNNSSVSGRLGCLVGYWQLRLRENDLSVGYIVACMYDRISEDLTRLKVVLQTGGTCLYP